VASLYFTLREAELRRRDTIAILTRLRVHACEGIRKDEKFLLCAAVVVVAVVRKLYTAAAAVKLRPKSTSRVESKMVEKRKRRASVAMTARRLALTTSYMWSKRIELHRLPNVVCQQSCLTTPCPHPYISPATRLISSHAPHRVDARWSAANPCSSHDVPYGGRCSIGL
jgi:hypothetical protein